MIVLDEFPVDAEAGQDFPVIGFGKKTAIIPEALGQKDFHAAKVSF